MKKSTAEFMREKVQRGGWQAVHVFDDNLPFTYSVGLFEDLGYELLVFGVDGQLGASLLHSFLEIPERSLDKLPMGEDVYLLGSKAEGNLPLQFRRCNASAHPFVVQADVYAGQEVPVVQIVLPDREGRHPEHPNYDRLYMDRFQKLCYDTIRGVH